MNPIQHRICKLLSKYGELYGLQISNMSPLSGRFIPPAQVYSNLKSLLKQNIVSSRQGYQNNRPVKWYGLTERDQE